MTFERVLAVFTGSGVLVNVLDVPPQTELLWERLLAEGAHQVGILVEVVDMTLNKKHQGSSQEESDCHIAHRCKKKNYKPL